MVQRAQPAAVVPRAARPYLCRRHVSDRPPEAQIAESAKTPDALRAAYTPRNAPPSAQARWLIDTVCENVADTHWARMQEHELLYRAADCNVLYLGDAAHGMVPTLGQGATQALEDAANAAALITQRYTDGKRDVEGWLSEIEALRTGAHALRHGVFA